MLNCYWHIPCLPIQKRFLWLTWKFYKKPREYWMVELSLHHTLPIGDQRQQDLVSHCHLLTYSSSSGSPIIQIPGRMKSFLSYPVWQSVKATMASFRCAFHRFYISVIYLDPMDTKDLGNIFLEESRRCLALLRIVMSRIQVSKTCTVLGGETRHGFVLNLRHKILYQSTWAFTLAPCSSISSLPNWGHT